MKTNLESLKTHYLFQNISAHDFEAISGLFNEKVMDEGMTVFVENMPGESLYIIRQGAIKISKMIAEGEEKTLVVLGANDVFGEMAILDGLPRAATARVAERVDLLSIRKADFESLCEKNPRLALTFTRNIVRIFCRRIRDNNEDYKEMLLWSTERKN